MVPSRTTGWLGPTLALCLLITGTETISKNFVNSSMPEMRPTFVVNFDMATVICQHSEDSTDLHLHEISVLCDGKNDCYQNPAMHDESFPYCERKCNSTCNDRGACLYDGEKPQCYCNSGFSGPTCEIVDKNECHDKPCHWLAHCQNTVGSYECACFPGFHGDGYQCADIDECSMSSYKCPENSVCVNLPGTYFCNCTEGFAPKGLPLEKCADINECEMNLHNCEPSQMCQNTVGGFKCVDRCSEGYEYVNGECVDIDECRQENVCDRRAECINTPGGYECKCDSGLAGDGKHCSPITDCSQQEDICDRHAFCIKSLKLCICQTGYVGDGITCNDVNECNSIANPCENQEGDRCVNIKGGYICCDNDVDDERCIRDKGAFCAGGCGLHAVCFNQTCQCMEGFIGNPHTRCIDVNECESNDMCAGVGQWCVNKMGGHICCSSDSEEPECQGVHVFKTQDGEVLLQYNESLGDVVVQHAGSYSHNTSGGTFITRQGLLKGEGLFPSVNVNRKNELMCTSYCPGQSECIDGICRCVKGFGGNPLFGCEDIDECVTNNPCSADPDTWCVNTIGGYHCCTPESTDTDCIGLEIAAGPDGGLRLTGGNRESFLASSLNESFSGETVSQSVHEVRNFSAGEILIVKNKVKSAVYEVKPKEGEVGLEIIGESKAATEKHPIPPAKTFPIELTTVATLLTVTLPGVISTLGGASTFTTSIPITEIPIHQGLPDEPVKSGNGSGVLELDARGIDLIGDQFRRTSVLPTFTSHESSGEEPKDSHGYLHRSTTLNKQHVSVTSQGAGESTDRPNIEQLGRSEAPKDEDFVVHNTTFSAITDAVNEVEISGEQNWKTIGEKKPGSSSVEVDSGKTSDSTHSISAATSESITKQSSAGVPSDEAGRATKSSKVPSITVSPLTPSGTQISGSGETIPTTTNPVDSGENEVGLEISFVPTGKPKTEKESGKPKKISVDEEGSGDDNVGSVVSNGGNVVITVSTATKSPDKVETATRFLEKGEVVSNEKGSFGSFTAKGEGLTAGSPKAPHTGTEITEEPIDGDDVGLEIIHNGARATPTPQVEVGLEIGPVHKSTATPDSPNIITDNEPGDSQETVDLNRPIKKTTKVPITTHTEVTEGAGEKVTTESSFEDTSGSSTTESASQETTEASGDAFSTSSEPSSSTEQPDLVLSMGTPQGGHPSSSTSNGEESTTGQPSLVLSTGTTAETSKSLSTASQATTSTVIGSTEETTSSVSTPTSAPKDGVSTATATGATSNPSVPEVDVDETEGSGIGKEDSKPEKEKTTKLLSSSEEGTSTTPKAELPATVTNIGDGSGDEVVVRGGISSTTTPAATLPTSAVTSAETTGETVATSSDAATVSPLPSTGHSDSPGQKLHSSPLPKVTKSPETSDKDIIKPNAESQRSPRPEVTKTPTTVPSPTSEGGAEENATTSAPVSTAPSTHSSSSSTSNIPKDLGTPSSTETSPTTALQQTESKSSGGTSTTTTSGPSSFASSTLKETKSSTESPSISPNPTTTPPESVSAGVGTGATTEGAAETVTAKADDINAVQSTTTAPQTEVTSGTPLTLAKTSDSSTTPSFTSETGLVSTSPTAKEATTSTARNEDLTGSSPPSTSPASEESSPTKFIESKSNSASPLESSAASTTPGIGTRAGSTVFSSIKTSTTTSIDVQGDLGTTDSSGVTTTSTSDFEKTGSTRPGTDTPTPDIRNQTQSEFTTSSIPIEADTSSAAPASTLSVSLSTNGLASESQKERNNLPTTTQEVDRTSTTAIEHTDETTESGTRQNLGSSTTSVLPSSTSAPEARSTSSSSSEQSLNLTSEGIRPPLRTSPTRKLLKTTTEHPTAAASVIPELIEEIENQEGQERKHTTPQAEIPMTQSSSTVRYDSTPDDTISDARLSTPKQNRAPVTQGIDETEEATTEVSTTKDTFILTTQTTPPVAEMGPSKTTKCTSGDQCGSDAYCERRTGACRCYPGFEGEPPLKSCRDVDECAVGLHKCDHSARCHNYVGGYACFCPMGYRKSEHGKCVDINECIESNGACCSVNATCINKQGSYGCVCKEGFFGDGYKCMPVEKRGCTEAEWSVANCGKNHMCMVDAKGNKDCDMCKMGFEVKDGECVDINECTEPTLNMCDRNAVCNNLMGTYACQCKKGFRGDGYMCEDEDECLMMPCHPQAECKNTPGSYECRCPDGFEGDGVKSCMNPLEQSCMEMEKFCGRTNHTACLSVRVFDGSLTSICECEPNYRYNEATKQCEDIDECAENRHNCDPASSVCVNEDGGFRCECSEGYEGTGGVCVDVNECERGIAGCHSMAMCINQPGSCGCKCIQGFTGDGTHCNAMGREVDNACTPEWQRLCKLENKTCHIDEEEVPQCGSCIEGHQPINGTCQPVHNGGNCADPSKNTCDVNAECIDVHPGRHFCTCKIGYIGDGMRCDDIDECSLAGICDPNATCRNFVGSFECTCNHGFTGNGFQCETSNTTTSPNCHLDSRLCHNDAECLADGKCKCRSGFEGDGIENCTRTNIATSHPTVSATTETTTSTISSPTTTNGTKGSIVPIDEKEVVELIPGETKQRQTTTSEHSKTTIQHGKGGSDSKVTTEFQRSTNKQILPVTTTSQVHHSASTTTTESITESTQIRSNTTQTDVIETGTTGIDEMSITATPITTSDNLSDGATKPTQSVSTNQPQDSTHITYESTEVPRSTPYVFEVTNSLVILQPSTSRPDEEKTGIFSSLQPFESSLTTEDVDVDISKVFQRMSAGTTSSPPETSTLATLESSSLDTANMTPESLKTSTESGFTVGLKANATKIREDETSSSPLSVVTSQSLSFSTLNSLSTTNVTPSTTNISSETSHSDALSTVSTKFPTASLTPSTSDLVTVVDGDDVLSSTESDNEPPVHISETTVSAEDQTPNISSEILIKKTTSATKMVGETVKGTPATSSGSHPSTVEFSTTTSSVEESSIKSTGAATVESPNATKLSSSGETTIATPEGSTQEVADNRSSPDTSSEELSQTGYTERGVNKEITDAFFLYTGTAQTTGSTTQESSGFSENSSGEIAETTSAAESSSRSTTVSFEQTKTSIDTTSQSLQSTASKFLPTTSPKEYATSDVTTTASGELTEDVETTLSFEDATGTTDSSETGRTEGISETATLFEGSGITDKPSLEKSTAEGTILTEEASHNTETTTSQRKSTDTTSTRNSDKGTSAFETQSPEETTLSDLGTSTSLHEETVTSATPIESTIETASRIADELAASTTAATVASESSNTSFVTSASSSVTTEKSGTITVTLDSSGFSEPSTKSLENPNRTQWTSSSGITDATHSLSRSPSRITVKPMSIETTRSTDEPTFTVTRDTDISGFAQTTEGTASTTISSTSQSTLTVFGTVTASSSQDKSRLSTESTTENLLESLSSTESSLYANSTEAPNTTSTPTEILHFSSTIGSTSILSEHSHVPSGSREATEVTNPKDTDATTVENTNTSPVSFYTATVLLSDRTTAPLEEAVTGIDTTVTSITFTKTTGTISDASSETSGFLNTDGVKTTSTPESTTRVPSENDRPKESFTSGSFVSITTPSSTLETLDSSPSSPENATLPQEQTTVLSSETTRDLTADVKGSSDIQSTGVTEPIFTTTEDTKVSSGKEEIVTSTLRKSTVTLTPSESSPGTGITEKPDTSKLPALVTSVGDMSMGTDVASSSSGEATTLPPTLSKGPGTLEPSESSSETSVTKKPHSSKLPELITGAPSVSDISVGTDFASSSFEEATTLSHTLSKSPATLEPSESSSETSVTKKPHSSKLPELITGAPSVSDISVGTGVVSDFSKGTTTVPKLVATSSSVHSERSSSDSWEDFGSSRSTSSKLSWISDPTSEMSRESTLVPTTTTFEGSGIELVDEILSTAGQHPPSETTVDSLLPHETHSRTEGITIDKSTQVSKSSASTELAITSSIASTTIEEKRTSTEKTASRSTPEIITGTISESPTPSSFGITDNETFKLIPSEAFTIGNMLGSTVTTSSKLNTLTSNRHVTTDKNITITITSNGVTSDIKVATASTAQAATTLPSQSTKPADEPQRSTSQTTEGELSTTETNTAVSLARLPSSASSSSTTEIPSKSSSVEGVSSTSAGTVEAFSTTTVSGTSHIASTSSEAITTSASEKFGSTSTISNILFSSTHGEETVSSTTFSTARSTTNLTHAPLDSTEAQTFTSTTPILEESSTISSLPKVFERERTSQNPETFPRVSQVTHGFPTNFITIDNDLEKTTPSTTAQSVVLEFLTPDDKNDLKINVPSSAGTREPKLTSSQSPTPQQEESSSTPTEDEKSPTTSIDVNEATTLSPLPDVKKESTTPKISTKPKDADSSGTTDRNPIMSQITTVPLDKSTLKEISTSFSVSPLIASSSTSRSSTELTSEPGISAQTTDLLSSPSINRTSNTTTEAGESHSERVTTPGQETSPNESTEATAPSTASRSFVTTSRDATNATPPTTLTVTVEIELHNQSTSKADVTLEEKTTTSHNINLPDNPEKTIEKTESSPMTTQPTKIKTDVSTQPNQTKANDVTKDDFGMVTESFVPTRTSSSSATTLSEIELLPKPDELVLIDGQIKVRHPNKQTKLPVLSTTSINEPNVGETSPTTEPVPSSFTVLSTGEHPASSQTSVQTTLKNEMSTEQTITTNSISENSTGSTFNIGTTTQKALREVTATELKTETTETAPVPQDLATVDFESLSQSTKLTTHTPTNEPDKGILNAETKAKSTVRPQKEHLSTSEPDEDRISDLSTTERTKTSTSLPEEEKTSSTSTEPLREISGDIVARAPTSAKSNSTTSPKSSNVVPESLTTRPDEIKTTAKPGGEEPPVTIQEEAKTTQEPGEIDSHISTVTASEENHSTTSGDLKPLVTEPGGEETTSNTGVPGTSQSSLMGARREEITPKSSGPSGPENFVTEPEEEQTTSAPSQPESQEPSTRALIPEGEDTTPMSGGPESSATGRNEEQTTQSGDTGDLQSSPTGGQTTPGTAHPGSREPSAEDLGTGREGTTPNTAREEETTPNPDGTEPPGTESGEEQTTPNSGITRGEQLSVTGPGGKQTTLENGQPGAREPSTEVNGPEGKDTTPRSGGTEPSGTGKGSKHNTPTVTGRGSQEVSATEPGVEQTTPKSAESESAKSSPTTMAETTSKSGQPESREPSTVRPIPEGKDTTPKSGGTEPPGTGSGEQTTPKSASGETSTEGPIPEGKDTTPKSGEGKDTTPKSGGTEPPGTGSGEQTTPKSASGETSTVRPIPEGKDTTPKSGGTEPPGTGSGEEQTTPKSASGETSTEGPIPEGKDTTPKSGGTEPPGTGSGEQTTPKSASGETSTEGPIPEGKDTTPKSGGTEPPGTGSGEQTTPKSASGETSTVRPIPEGKDTTPKSGEGKDTTPKSGGTEPPGTGSGEQTTPKSASGETSTEDPFQKGKILRQSLVVQNLLVQDRENRPHRSLQVEKLPLKDPFQREDTTPKRERYYAKVWWYRTSWHRIGEEQTTPKSASGETSTEGPIPEGKDTTPKSGGTEPPGTGSGEQTTPKSASGETSTEGPIPEGKDTTPKSGGTEPPGTGSGEEQTTPKSASGETSTEGPIPEGKDTTPKSGGTEPPGTGSGEEQTTPKSASGETSTVRPIPEGKDTTPKSGGTEPPGTGSGEEQTTPKSASGETSTEGPIPEGKDTTPKSGGTQSPSTGSGEEQTTPKSASGETSTVRPIPEGKDTTPKSGGTEPPGTGSGEQTTPKSASGETSTVRPIPEGKDTTPKSGGKDTTKVWWYKPPGTGREKNTPKSASGETSTVGPIPEGKDTTPKSGGTEPPGTGSGEEQTTPKSASGETSTVRPIPEGKDTTPKSGGTEPPGTGSGEEQTTPKSASGETSTVRPIPEGKDTTPKSGGPETSVTGPAEEQTTPKSGDTENLQSSPTGGQTTAGTVHLESREPSIEDLGPRREGTTPKNAKKEEITPKSGGAEPSVTGPGIKQTTPKSTLTEESESSPTAIVGTTSKSGHPDSQESSTRTPIPEGEETTPKSGGPETSVTRPSEEQTTLKSGDAGDLQSSPTGEQTTPRTVRPGSREPSAEGLGPGGEETTRSTKGEEKTTPKSGGGKPSVAVPGEEITPHPGPPENRKPSTEEPSPEGKDTIPPSSGTEPLMTVSTEQTTPESGGPGGKEHSVTGSARKQITPEPDQPESREPSSEGPGTRGKGSTSKSGSPEPSVTGPGEEPTTPKAGGPGGKQLSVTEPGRKQTTPEPGQPESREHPSEGPGTRRGETTPKRLGEGKTTSKPAGTDHSTTWQGREQVTPEPDQPAGREPSTEGPGSEVEKTTPKSNGVEPFVTGKGSKDNIPMVTGPGGQEVSVTGPGMEQTTLSAETESMEPSSIVEEQTTPKPGHLESREPSTGARVPTVEETTAKFGKEEPTTLNSDGPQPSVTVTKNQQTTLKPKNQKSSTEEPGAGEKQITTKSGGPGGPKLSPTESGGEKTTPETRSPETRKPFTEGLRREEETTPKSGKQARSETVPRGDQTTPNSDQSENRRSSTETLGPRGKQTKPKSAGPEASVTAPGQELTTPRTEEIGAQKTPVTEQRGEQTTPSPDQSNGQNTLTRSGLTKTSIPPNSRLESTVIIESSTHFETSPVTQNSPATNPLVIVDGEMNPELINSDGQRPSSRSPSNEESEISTTPASKLPATQHLLSTSATKAGLDTTTPRQPTLISSSPNDLDMKAEVTPSEKETQNSFSPPSLPTFSPREAIRTSGTVPSGSQQQLFSTQPISNTGSTKKFDRTDILERQSDTTAFTFVTNPIEISKTTLNSISSEGPSFSVHTTTESSTAIFPTELHPSSSDSPINKAIPVQKFNTTTISDSSESTRTPSSKFFTKSLGKFNNTSIPPKHSEGSTSLPTTIVLPNNHTNISRSTQTQGPDMTSSPQQNLATSTIERTDVTEEANISSEFSTISLSTTTEAASSQSSSTGSIKLTSHQQFFTGSQTTTRMHLVKVDGSMNPGLKTPVGTDTSEFPATKTDTSISFTEPSATLSTIIPSGIQTSTLNPTVGFSTPHSQTPSDVSVTKPDNSNSENQKIQAPPKTRNDGEQPNVSHSKVPVDASTFTSSTITSLPTLSWEHTSPTSEFMSSPASLFIPDREPIPSKVSPQPPSHTLFSSPSTAFPPSSLPTTLHPAEFELTTAPPTAHSSPPQPSSFTDAPTNTHITSSVDQGINPPDVTENGLKATTEDDLSVVVESFESTTGSPNDLPQQKQGRCSASDRTMCHELAICEIATGACRCKDGFTGDGYNNCT
ncbi:hypothetical protein RB195_011467 [Necator americanus]|uniref:EGF-like domain-containing protein n=1 Tax=Necator americanus TaxID=51031 RepID=A0ABR1D2L0_NECAM